MPLLQPLGRTFLDGLEAIGRLFLFTLRALFLALRPPYHPPLIVRQMIEIGYYSLPVVGMTAVFTGMVLALQSYTGFARFNAETAIPNVVVLSICRELGPAMAGPAGRARRGGPDGRRAHWRRDGGGARHHAGDRTDRRPGHALHQPLQIPDRAAPG